MDVDRRTGLVVGAALVVVVGALVAVVLTRRDATPPVATTPTGSPTPTAPGAATPPATTTASPSPVQPATVAVTTTVVAEGIAAPWGLAFVGDERAYVTEQDTGRVLELPPGGPPREVHRFSVDAAGEGGLLGLAASPSFARDGLLYAYYTAANDNRVVRFEPGGDAEPILTGIPKATIHNGGRIAFGPDDLLYIGTGDASVGERAQDRSSLAGKILRITPDGGIPDDNPFGDSPVYSLGHRNVQGLAWDGDGQLHAAEFGPNRDDEVNRIQAGGNYGWPMVTGRAGRDGLIDPVFVRQPADASWSGTTFLVDGAIPQWDGNLFLAALRGQRLWRVSLTDAEPSAEALLVGEYGRLRQVVQAPDGSLWVTTSNRDGYGDPRPGDDRIIRLGP
ncbi:MAG: PQQ-dependent sugar dehydrogenase [Actinobacteria bacterium]|nr:PQQ-dependent sugar dehydrogenase [Actinomycetota bacterium]